jgi:hypothetical protein
MPTSWCEMTERPVYAPMVLTSSDADRCIAALDCLIGLRCRYSDKNTRRSRFQRRMVGMSRAVASSWNSVQSLNLMNVHPNTYCECMPNVRERFRNEMKNTDTSFQERNMIVPHVTPIYHSVRPRNKITGPFPGRHRVAIFSCKSTAISQPLLSGSERIEQPSSIYKVVLDRWLWCP